jgi:hypothetical protein
VLLELLALLQAASTPIPSTTAAPAANLDLTPSPPQAHGHAPCMVIPAETAPCRPNDTKSIFPWDSWGV